MDRGRLANRPWREPSEPTGWRLPDLNTAVIGATCPYDHAVIKPGQTYTRCPKCGTPHHADCWKENRGCAVFRCGQGVDAPLTQQVVADPSRRPRRMEQLAAVPALVGMTWSEALAKAEQVGFRAIVSYHQGSNTVPSGQVISQIPAAGTPGGGRHDIHVILSLDPSRTTAPASRTLPETMPPSGEFVWILVGSLSILAAVTLAGILCR
jgi:hypothetical protein